MKSKKRHGRGPQKLSVAEVEVREVCRAVSQAVVYNPPPLVKRPRPHVVVPVRKKNS